MTATAIVDLAFEERGSGEPAVVLIHGWSCDRSYLEPQLQHFSAAHRTVAVDLRGHGGSPVVDGPYDIGTLAADVAALCRRLDLGPAIVVGHSMGAVTALRLAADHPDLVGAVVMLDSAPLGMEGPLRDWFHTILEAMGGPDELESRRRFCEAMFLDGDDQALRTTIVEAMTSRPNHVAIQCLAAIIEHDGAGAARACSVPVLVLGAQVPAARAESITAACPHAVIGQLTGVGHFLQLLRPDEVHTRIDAFMASHVTPRWASPA